MVSPTTARRRRRQRLRSTAVPTLRGTANATRSAPSVSCAGRNCTLTGPDQARCVERRSWAKTWRPRTGLVRGRRDSAESTGNAVPIVVRSRGGVAGGSSRQPSASAAAARFDDRSPRARGHPMTEAVFSRPFPGVRLERPLHLSLVSSFRCRTSGSVSRRGSGPVIQVPSTRRDENCILRAKARVHQTAGTGPGNLAQDPRRDQADALRQDRQRRCTIPAPCVLAPPSTPVDAGVENFSTGGPRAGDRSTTTVE